MAAQQHTSMYHVPASQEAVVVRSPEAFLSDIDLARKQALESASDMRSADPMDIDQSRIETSNRIESLLGKSTVAAAETIAPASPEVSFDPTNKDHFVEAGIRVLRMRAAKRDGFDLAA